MRFESCDSKVAVSIERMRFDSESIFCDSTFLRFDSLFCFSLRNFWRFQARDSGNCAILDSRFCAAKFRGAQIRNEKAAQRESSWPGCLADVRHPCDVWSQKHSPQSLGAQENRVLSRTSMTRGSLRKTLCFGLIFCSLCKSFRNTPSTAGNSMTSSERPSPEPLLKEEASSAVLGGREFWKCSGAFKCLGL